MYETIRLKQEDAVATIVFNRPQTLNAFNLTMHEEVYDALNRAADDDAVRCIVLKGSGKGFSAGADLGAIDLSEEEPDLGKFLRKTYNRLLMRMVEVDKPIVASLHGPVYGAGLGVALACDFRIAAAGSTYCMAFIKIGLVPDAGTSFFLPRLMGLGRALEMAMLGETLSAEEAFRAGLVNRVVPDEALEKETMKLAGRLAQAPTKALALTKRLMAGSFEKDLATALEAEARGQSEAGKTRDFLEGISAFFQKRPPRFTGK